MAAEASNMRIQCKKMADEKAERLWLLNPYLRQQPEVIRRLANAKYDAKNDRCYIEIFDHHKAGGQRVFDLQQRQIYDAQKDDLLAFAKIQKGKKVGMVFDPTHRSTMGNDLGWQDANSYIDRMMADPRK